MKKNAVAVAETQVVETTKFVIPEEYKKTKYKDWPDSLKQQYQKYRKDGYNKKAKELDELWQQLVSKLEGDALDLALKIKNFQAKKRENALEKIFGDGPYEIGTAAPFNMDLLNAVQNINRQGKYVLEITDNQIVISDIKEAETEADITE